MDKYQELANLLKDEEKAKSIVTDSLEETQKNLADNGLDFSVEELEQIANAVELQNSNGELSEDSLDNVSGGLIMPTVPIGIFKLTAKIVASVVSWKNKR